MVLYPRSATTYSQSKDSAGVQTPAKGGETVVIGSKRRRERTNTSPRSKWKGHFSPIQAEEIQNVIFADAARHPVLHPLQVRADVRGDHRVSEFLDRPWYHGQQVCRPAAFY